jgi:uncharacterized protein (TIGR02302 family)
LNDQGHDLGQLHRRLAGRREITRLTLLFERLWPAVWPATGVAGLFLVLALLGLPRLLSPLVHLAYLAIFAVAFVVMLFNGLRRLALPADHEADRRLETISGIAHRPLAVLSDRPSNPDETGHALWQAHVTRAIAQVRRLRLGLPHPGLARRDRRALRAGLLVALIASLVVAGGDAPARLGDAVRLTLPRGTPVPSTLVQAWITPPDYTHQAPIFLRNGLTAVSVPSASHLTASVTGGSGIPRLTLDGQAAQFRALDQGSFQADLTLSTGGHLAIRRGGEELAGWDITVVNNRPPIVAWAEPPGPAPIDPEQVRLPWKTSDDYGVTSLRVEMHLQARASAPPVSLDIPLPNDEAKSAHGVEERDLTANPWAGLAVTAQLIARDGAGLEGRSTVATFTLPERVFHNPVAKALIEIRKGLSLRPDDRDTALAGLDQLLVHPKAFGDDYAAYLNLSGIYYLLEHDESADAVPRAQNRMWELALHMEHRSLDRTARQLEEARQAAKDALARAQQDPSKANRQALEQKLRELEQAIQQRMQALMEQLAREGKLGMIPPNAMNLSSRDMQRLAEQAREAAQQGDMKTAQQRMAELEQMLDALRNGHPMTAQEMQNQQQMQKGRRQLGVIQDLIGRQSQLLDHAQQRAQPADNNADNNSDAQQPAPSPQSPSDAATQRQADKRVQQALRDALGEVMQQFGDLTGKIPPSLGKADQDMQQAGQALAQGKDEAAGKSEEQAIADLSKGGQQMSQQMAQQFGNGQEGQQGQQQGPGLALSEQPGDGPGNGPLPGHAGQRDPLGRPYEEGHNGADETDQVTIPDKAQQQRAQEIEQVLRERGGQRTRPQEELDYINRLLKQF